VDAFALLNAYEANYETADHTTVALLNIGASLLLMGPLGAVGLGLATAIASASNCLQLVLRLRRRIGALEGRAILRAAGKVGLAHVFGPLLTSQFLHGSPLHLGFNMLFEVIKTAPRAA
jgi:peptidoglycan biosynthesis protein MviN/MurJ (putative lipid II flippase)